MIWMKAACRTSVSLFSLAVAATAAHAQTAPSSSSSQQVDPAASPQTTEAGPPTGNQLADTSGDIIVTAQRRAERVLDVPQSLTALSSADLERLGARQLVDIVTAVPGVQFTSQGAGSGSISIRGVSTGADIGRTVSTYVDDVPYGSTSGFGGSPAYTADVALFDLDRVELLRGPQGTLYGASSMGGLLKYVTRAPSLTTFGGAVNAGVAGTRFGGTSYNGNAVINLPLATDGAALRASAFYSREGGYVDNIQNGQQNVGASRVYGGRLDLLLAPVDNLTTRLTGFAQDIRRNGGLYSDRYLNGQPANGLLDQAHPFAEPYRASFRLAAANVTYNFGAATLTSITSYQQARTENQPDFSELYVPYLQLVAGLPLTGVRASYAYDTNKFTQEVRLASRTGARFEWQIGGFYTHEDVVNRIKFFSYGAGLTPFPLNLATADIPSSYQEYAAFGNLTWHLTDKLDVSGGIRWSHNNQSYTQNATGILLGSAPTSYSRESVTTYLANLRYHFSTNVMAYARFATGYRPGGPNVTTRDLATGQLLGPTTFGSDTLRSYEAGLKADTRDRTFSIDASGYYIDWSNIQLYNVVNGNSTITNVGGARVKGAELTLTARPDPNVTISGAFAYNDGYLTTASATLGATKGDRLPNAPHFTAAVNADYVLRSASFRPTFGATLRYVGDRTSGFDASAGSPQYHLPDYVLADLRAGFSVGMFDVQLYVHNVFDERAQLSASTVQSILGGPAQITILRPRSIGMNVGVHF